MADVVAPSPSAADGVGGESTRMTSTSSKAYPGNEAKPALSVATDDDGSDRGRNDGESSTVTVVSSSSSEGLLPWMRGLLTGAAHSHGGSFPHPDGKKEPAPRQQFLDSVRGPTNSIPSPASTADGTVHTIPGEDETSVDDDDDDDDDDGSGSETETGGDVGTSTIDEKVEATKDSPMSNSVASFTSGSRSLLVSTAPEGGRVLAGRSVSNLTNSFNEEEDKGGGRRGSEVIASGSFHRSPSKDADAGDQIIRLDGGGSGSGCMHAVVSGILLGGPDTLGLVPAAVLDDSGDDDAMAVGDGATDNTQLQDGEEDKKVEKDDTSATPPPPEETEDSSSSSSSSSSASDHAANTNTASVNVRTVCHGTFTIGNLDMLEKDNREKARRERRRNADGGNDDSVSSDTTNDSNSNASSGTDRYRSVDERTANDLSTILEERDDEDDSSTLGEMNVSVTSADGGGPTTTLLLSTTGATGDDGTKLTDVTEDECEDGGGLVASDRSIFRVTEEEWRGADESGIVGEVDVDAKDDVSVATVGTLVTSNRKADDGGNGKDGNGTTTPGNESGGAAPRPDGEATTQKVEWTELSRHISHKRWGEAEERCRDFPREATVEVDIPAFRGCRGLPLHLACSTHRPGPPPSTVRALLGANPAAAGVREGTWDQLPLHFACMSGASRDVVDALVDAYPMALRMREGFGGYLPLHVACHRNAPVDVVRRLHDGFPGALAVADMFGDTPREVVSKGCAEEAGPILDVFDKSDGGHMSVRDIDSFRVGYKHMDFEICGFDLRKTTKFWFIKKAPDTFFEIALKKSNEAGDDVWMDKYRSDTVAKSTSPAWDNKGLDLELLCDGNCDLPIKLSVFKVKKSGLHSLMGSCEATLHEMAKARSPCAISNNANKKTSLQGLPLQSPKGKKGVGFVGFIHTKINLD